MTHFTLITKTSRHVWSYQQINIHRLWGRVKVPGLHFQLVRKTYILQYFDFITNNNCDLNLQVSNVFPTPNTYVILLNASDYIFNLYVSLVQPGYLVTDKLIWHSKYNPDNNCTKHCYLSPFKVITSVLTLMSIKDSFDQIPFTEMMRCKNYWKRFDWIRQKCMFLMLRIKLVGTTLAEELCATFQKLQPTICLAEYD